MKVINLYGDDFNKACKDLANLTCQNGYCPDVTIGILTGGGEVGKETFKTIQQKNPNALYTEVKIQRGSTKAKESSKVRKLLKRLPEWLLNIMRVIEVELLELKAKFIKPNRYGEITFSPEISQVLSKGNNKILLIDDCIDTGYTFKALMDCIEKRFPNNTVKTAVVTIAHRHPIISVDFHLYNRTLIRFPWANDAKTE